MHGLNFVQDPNERIYIIASYAPYARELLCEVRVYNHDYVRHLLKNTYCTFIIVNFTNIQAYHRNIRYPTHLLLTYQWYGPNWWLVEDQNYTCTGEQRGEVLHMTLSMDIYNSSYPDNGDNYTSMNIVSL